MLLPRDNLALEQAEIVKVTEAKVFLDCFKKYICLAITAT
jgi:hypothetical protein